MDIKIDFSEELISKSNFGSALETGSIKSIVNTLGKFYDVKMYLLL